MTTEKQAAANRLNALKGGVKTTGGKVAVRLNAVSHGLYSKEVLLPGEDVFQLNALREQVLAETNPQSEIENVLVERIVACTWRLKRALHYETAQHKRDINYRFGHWEPYMRYETALEHQIYRALRQLLELQKCRFLWQLALNDSSQDAESSRPPVPSSVKALAALQKFYKRNPVLLDDESP